MPIESVFFCRTSVDRVSGELSQGRSSLVLWCWYWCCGSAYPENIYATEEANNEIICRWQRVALQSPIPVTCVLTRHLRLNPSLASSVAPILHRE